ncbi:hypothetical protein NEPTK9_000985 [Candidatus Neptunochlamydia vexilliferae]|uniref:Uncharacterized protein n=1 Tax=Candidatus Neptunichlamydia vexilliferae TaxID=1651774 RepID=A0ABS0AZB1_9BACT|nr:hypothetical protein [Candidatus Neptunochlamydia vexilliferae]
MRRGQAPCCPLELQPGKPNRPSSGGRAKHCSAPRSDQFCIAILKPWTLHDAAFLRLRLRSCVGSVNFFVIPKQAQELVLGNAKAVEIRRS